VSQVISISGARLDCTAGPRDCFRSECCIDRFNKHADISALNVVFGGSRFETTYGKLWKAFTGEKQPSVKSRRLGLPCPRNDLIEDPLPGAETWATSASH